VACSAVLLWHVVSLRQILLVRIVVHPPQLRIAARLLPGLRIGWCAALRVLRPVLPAGTLVFLLPWKSLFRHRQISTPPDY
jgi:hypothetical protein